MKIEPLPPSRWRELDRPLRESRSDESLPQPEQAIMLAASEGEDIIGVIGAERVWLVSPFWVQRERRGNGLALELVNHLAAYNTEGLREVCATTNSHVERLIYAIGFIPVDGQLWRREVRNVK